MDPALTVPRTTQHSNYDPAIKLVRRLGKSVPSGLRGALSDVVDDDRAEQTAFQVAALIEQWLATKGLAP